MANTITLFEHEFTSDLDLTKAEANKVTRLNQTLGRSVLKPQFRAGKIELKAAEHVGVVRFGRQTVQILPKIYRTENFHRDKTESVYEATENLLYLLAYSGKLPIRESEIANLARQSSDWFEILTRMFAQNLINEWEKGAVRHYQMVEKNLPVLKGKWRLNQQMRRPAGQHVFSIAYDEFTPDNKLNRIFRFVVERLWRLTRDAKNRQLLGDLRMLLDEVTLLSNVSANDATPTLLSRMNSRFTPLLNLARLFLSESAFRLAHGDTETFAFVFDMNVLFENFLTNFIRRHRIEILPEELQICDILPQTKGATRHLAHRDESPVFRLKPDLAFRSIDKKFPLLIDAKYKKLSDQSLILGIGQSDFYQMHAYAHRFECPNIAIIFPQTADMETSLRVRFQLHGSPIIVTAATIDLRLRLTRQTEREKLMCELKEILGFLSELPEQIL